MPNGHITHYSVYYYFNNTPSRRRRNHVDLLRRSTFMQRVSQRVGASAEIEYTLNNLTGLVPYTLYVVWVSASTLMGEGPMSDTSTVRTDTEGMYARFCSHTDAAPSPPRMSTIVHSRNPNTDAVHAHYARIEWHAPRTVYRRVDMYMLRVVVDDGVSDEPLLNVYNCTDDQQVCSVHMDQSTMLSVDVGHHAVHSLCGVNSSAHEQHT
jgi:hypothetical protein